MIRRIAGRSIRLLLPLAPTNMLLPCHPVVRLPPATSVELLNHAHILTPDLPLRQLILPVPLIPVLPFLHQALPAALSAMMVCGKLLGLLVPQLRNMEPRGAAVLKGLLLHHLPTAVLPPLVLRQWI